MTRSSRCRHSTVRAGRRAAVVPGGRPMTVPDDRARERGRSRADEWEVRDRPGGDEGLDQPWPAPAPGYEPYHEPEYEGDSW